MDSSAVMELLVEHAMARHTQSINALNARYLDFIQDLLRQQSAIQDSLHKKLNSTLKDIIHYKSAAKTPRVSNVCITDLDDSDDESSIDQHSDNESDHETQEASDVDADDDDASNDVDTDDDDTDDDGTADVGNDHDGNTNNEDEEINTHELYVAGFSLECKQCQKIFALQTDYRKHMSTLHQIKKPYQCHICDKKYTNRGGLIEHIKLKHANISRYRYQCQTCEKQFMYKSALKEHTRSHEDARPYACTHRGCKKTFKVRGNLKKHISRVHNKEIRYTCKTCGKGFFHKTDCTRHVRTHTCERPFACKICKKRFNEKGSKRKHEKKCRNIKSEL